MKVLLFLTALALLAIPRPATGQDVAAVVSGEAKALTLRPKNMIQPTPLALQRAPFVANPGEPVLDLLPRPEDERMKASRSSCERPGQSLCYDSSTGKIVYKKTREYMPELPGLQPEHISLRRDRLTFKYSFR